MKPIKITFYIIALFFSCLAIIQFIIFLAPEVKGEEEQFNPEYHLDLTYSYEWATTTKMTATVPDSPCRYCLRNFNPTKCLDVCDIIVD